jgi:hypothetical protein
MEIGTAVVGILHTMNHARSIPYAEIKLHLLSQNSKTYANKLYLSIVSFNFIPGTFRIKIRLGNREFFDTSE